MGSLNFYLFFMTYIFVSYLALFFFISLMGALIAVKFLKSEKYNFSFILKFNFFLCGSISSIVYKFISPDKEIFFMSLVAAVIALFLLTYQLRK